MYLLFVDESGTHGGSHAFVLGGLAIHEADAARLQRRLEQVVIDGLGRTPLNLEEYELHASELRNAKKPRGSSLQVSSVWSAVPRTVRLQVLEAAYSELATFRPTDPDQPLALFGVVVGARFRPDWTPMERERFSYEVLLNKFDVMLKRVRRQRDLSNRGLVIHDRRVVEERDIQSWTSEWRKAAGSIGRLRNLADVPLFADSRATRLLQAADLISYAVYRRYRPGPPEDRSGEAFARLWRSFDREGDVVHGVVHYTPDHGRGDCTCEPCIGRLASSRGAPGPDGAADLRSSGAGH